ncbi:MAG: caspase family protein [Candidatus Obscuribacterales bacterium]|nr:caspase family protein [Candidatus Obscuribacterales bacterium]
MILRSVFVLVVFLLLALPSWAQNKPVDDKWALVVGISKFKDASMNLRYPAKDASDFRDFLIKEAHFAPDHVKLITDEQATRARILTEVGDTWLPHAAGPNDLVLIYMSSHGSPSQMDNEGFNYLVAHDTQKDQLYATGIRLENLADTIKERVHCDRTVIILDACHSGAAKAKTGGKSIVRQGNFDIGEIPMGKGLMLICSSQPQEVSWESKKYENGVFTKQLMDGFKYRGDYTRLGEAFTYMKDKVQEEVLRDRGQLQTPVVRSAWKGDDIVLSAKPAKPKPGLPDTTPSSPPASTSVAMAIPGSQSAGFSATNTGAIAGSMVNVKLLDRVAILPVTGPKQIILDDIWKGFAEKDHIDIPRRLKEVGLRSTIQQVLKKKLAKYLKDKPVFALEFAESREGNTPSDDELLLVESKALSPEPGVFNWQAAGNLSQAKYLVEITIHDIFFQDQMGNDLAGARISAKLVSGETGEVLWLQKKKKFSRTTFSSHDDSIFAEVKNFIPNSIAGAIAKPIANLIKDQ